MQKLFFSILLLGVFVTSRAQSLGGNSVFNFLKLPASPQLTGLGSVNVSTISNDVGMAFNNPALLRPSMHSQLSTVFNLMYGGIKNYHLMMGYSHQQLRANFGLGVHYIDYGTITQTDPSGNILGTFRPGDYVVQASASRRYMDKWHYGATLKFIHSSYGIYRSTGIALDAGVAYYDSSQLLQVSLLLKNMGVQVKKYAGTEGDDLPFDIALGITRRLKNAPIQFSLTAQHLHQFDIRYNDTAFNNDNGFGNGKFNIDKIFRHFIVAAQFYVEDYIELTAAYNHLRRSELNIDNATNGLNGFSLGVGALFKKIQLRYARAYYQNNRAYNQFGINLRMDEFVGW